jgi:DNA-binding PadR family transcriptional regulator
VLRRLEDARLVAQRPVAQRGRPDKVVYRITAAGRAALVAWVEEVEDEPTGGPSVFLLKFLFAWAAPPQAAFAQLDAYERHLKRTVAHFEQRVQQLPADDPPHSLAALRHGIARGKTTLEWIEKTRKTLKRS